MPEVFDKLGLRFLYPDNWTVETDEDRRGQPAVSVEHLPGEFRARPGIGDRRHTPLSLEDLERPATASGVPGAAPWRAKDHLAHLVKSERNRQRLLRAILAGETRDVVMQLVEKYQDRRLSDRDPTIAAAALSALPLRRP
jgi:hypothetical protein